MQYLRFYIVSILLLAIICFYLFIDVTNNKEIVTPKPIILTNTDTLYQDIERLKIKSDTIKIKYETKINAYRTAPIDGRIQLFSDRINR
jgi:hypothetical protein